MATRVTTAGTGAFKFGGKTFKIKSTTDNVIFILDENENVTGIEGLEGTVAADFSEEIKVNGDEVQVVGDKNSNVTVTAAASGVTEISGVNGDSVTIVSAGNAKAITTSSSGNFIIKEKEYVIKGDKNGVTFDLDKSGNVSGVEELDGTIAADISEGVSVNSKPVQVSGEKASVSATTSNGVTAISVSNNSEVKVASAGGATKVSTDVDGKIEIAKTVFELKDSSGADFVLDENGNVTGITNFKGSLFYEGSGNEFAINKSIVKLGRT